MFNNTESTKDEIRDTYQMLEKWGLLDEVSTRDRKTIFRQLTKIAMTASNDTANMLRPKLDDAYNELREFKVYDLTD